MFPKLTPITKNIIILNVIIYVIANFIYPNLYPLFQAYFPLSPNFHSWQIITHMFMHAPLGQGYGIMHILFNMMTLWSFGPVLEQIMGEKKYVILYFVSGLAGFVLFNLWNYYEIHQLMTSLTNEGVNVAEIFQKANLHYSGDMNIAAKTPLAIAQSQQLYGELVSPMLGASAAIMGVVAGFATLFPDSKLYMMFIPIGIKAKYMVIGFVVISFFLQITGRTLGIAHFAHIGGAIAGFLIARHFAKNRYRIN
ncbi:rhomboid family intramembrane serine protease [Halpernia frigidisoli]|uniref:Membrane associated serine protease, rhomboid family n=1 Tax=Halpernia frigidisoli TaxID=1125876 RepID=A0A1I3GNQ0_9FLAO|nr:rhomboid family intramembrane serine protease [Halpernia frigidisoli]SFI25138.1 Membrane associated serine protease, rhomboid family [Halpernia frigidisoli]